MYEQSLTKINLIVVAPPSSASASVFNSVFNSSVTDFVFNSESADIFHFLFSYSFSYSFSFLFFIIFFFISFSFFFSPTAILSRRQEDHGTADGGYGGGFQEHGLILLRRIGILNSQ